MTGESGPTPPCLDRGTGAAKSYFLAWSSTIAFFHFMIDLVASGDFAAYLADRFLKNEDRGPVKEPGDLIDIGQPGERTKFLRRNRQIFLEMFFCRLVDDFHSYITDVLREVFAKEPRVLTSSQASISTEYLFQFTEIDELITDIVETKVNELSYQGFGRLSQWCIDRGIPLLMGDSCVDEVTELTAIRNVIAHNRGIVDKRYRRGVSDTTFEVGDLRRLTIDDYFRVSMVLNGVVCATDPTIAAKFDLHVSDFAEDVEAQAHGASSA